MQKALIVLVPAPRRQAKLRWTMEYSTRVSVSYNDVVWCHLSSWNYIVTLKLLVRFSGLFVLVYCENDAAGRVNIYHQTSWKMEPQRGQTRLSELIPIQPHRIHQVKQTFISACSPCRRLQIAISGNSNPESVLVEGFTMGKPEANLINP